MSEKIKCIKCGRFNTCFRQPDGNCYCKHCQITFDDQDDGTTGYGRPENNAARNEEYRMRKQGRLPRK